MERINCPVPRSEPDDDDEDFIRVIVNGAVQELETCREVPGGSCPMEDFGGFVAERVERCKDFEGACGVVE